MPRPPRATPPDELSARLPRSIEPPLMPSPEALALYLACVVLASVLQNLTAFAFGLVLLGLVERISTKRVRQALKKTT